ncbi:Uncharacterised protein [Acinetobacter baumannii]|nr:Uncharacterised protein [Acinetobacter baumannii]
MSLNLGRHIQYQNNQQTIDFKKINLKESSYDTRYDTK